MEEFSIPEIALACVIGLVAGTMKGAAGFALPTIMAASLGAYMEPRLALALIIFPSLFTNLWQSFRDGAIQAVRAIRKFWRLLLSFAAVLVFSAQLVIVLPTDVFYVMIGLPVVGFSLLQLVGFRLRTTPENAGRLHILAGGVAGFTGGFSGMWGLPVVLALASLDVEKRQQVQIQGIIFLAGSIILLVAHLNSGVLNAGTIPASVLVAVPAMIGMWIGFRIQDRLNQDQYRKVAQVLLLFLGLNLMARGLIF